jgi:hypothetical protein
LPALTEPLIPWTWTIPDQRQPEVGHGTLSVIMVWMPSGVLICFHLFDY